MAYDDISDDEMPLIRWDNYIGLFENYFSIIKIMFACHEDSRNEKTYEYNDVMIYELLENIDYWISKAQNVIINIDIDYFFVNDGSRIISCMSDDFIKYLFMKIKALNSKQNVKVITIALSPECCDGWGNAFRKMKLIKQCLDLDIDIF